MKRTEIIWISEIINDAWVVSSLFHSESTLTLMGVECLLGRKMSGQCVGTHWAWKWRAKAKLTLEIKTRVCLYQHRGRIYASATIHDPVTKQDCRTNFNDQCNFKMAKYDSERNICKFFYSPFCNVRGLVKFTLIWVA